MRDLFLRKQLHGGYVLSSVKNSLSKLDKPIIIGDLLSRLSLFEIDYHFTESPIDDPVPVILDNLISRGLPTFPSIFIEDKFSEIFCVSEKIINKIGAINYQATEKFENYIDPIYQSLFIVEPRLKALNISHEFFYDDKELDSQQEELFINSLIPQEYHESFTQLLEPQRNIQDIVKYANFNGNSTDNNQEIPQNDFFNQRIDFSFEFPLAKNKGSAIAIEIDGPHHGGLTQKYFDQQRDELLVKLGWSSTVRLQVSELNNIPRGKQFVIKNFLEHPYPEVIKNNYDQPIWEREFGLAALQISLSPFAIARVQKIILFLILNGFLDLEASEWTLAVIERDVPCAAMAIQDIKDLFINLFSLEGKGRSLPEIKLEVYVTDEFKDCGLNKDVTTNLISDFSSISEYDAVIDISILQKFGFEYPKNQIPSNGKNLVKIRSSNSKKSDRIIKSAKPIVYDIPEKETPEALIFFLNNLFRKNDFLDGQVDILRRALNLKSVIALLPTGAGKSLTYQLSALLQPGIVLIIDPLKSLMQDQNDNLLAAGIDSSIFINSSITTQERIRRSKEFVKGHYKFIFISPERLQIEEFRDHLKNMTETAFSYAVVDEAHCVSEWGHDFRPAYLRLGQNVRKYCKTQAEEIPILALTGTASFDVLADVQRELMIQDESSIVSPSDYGREELNFKVVNVESYKDESHSYEKLPEAQIKKNVAEKKISSLVALLNNTIPKNNWKTSENYPTLESFFSRDLPYKNSGIIFCPHKTWLFGVLEVASELKNQFPSLDSTINVFAGNLDDEINVDLELVQEQFKNDEIGLLVATKAFGMGIDKPNIRFTVHFNMPQSIESFYQEAGRAGRDRDRAYCYILYSPAQIKKDLSLDKSWMLSFHNNSFKGVDKEKHIIWELLHQLKYPRFDLNAYLSDIKAKFDHDFSFNIWENGDLTRLYINGDYPKCFGSIDLSTLRVFPEKRKERILLDQNDSKSFLSELLSELKSKCPDDKSLKEFLTNPPSLESQPGFEKILEKMNLGGSSQVAVSFENGIVKDIEDYLQSRNFSYHKGLVSKSCNYCFSPEEFIENLTSNYYRMAHRNVRFSQEDQIYLKNAFNKIRDEQDTYKAIYRLSVIGVVDDYVVDYNSRHIITTITKKTDQEYINHLTDYIGRYVSVEEKRITPQKILQSDGNSVIQKCCGYLINFVYDKIEKKRKSAIDIMETSIVEGLESDQIFTERINTYFDSKYTPLLRDYTVEYDIDLVWDYMDKTSDDPDGVSHLRGACDRLLTENPENAAFLLLRAYSKLLTPSYDKSEALQDYRAGWKEFNKQKNLSRTQYLSHVSKYYDKTVRNDQRTAEHLEPEILKEHISWLSSFNESFTKELTHA